MEITLQSNHGAEIDRLPTDGGCESKSGRKYAQFWFKLALPRPNRFLCPCRLVSQDPVFEWKLLPREKAIQRWFDPRSDPVVILQIAL